MICWVSSLQSDRHNETTSSEISNILLIVTGTIDLDIYLHWIRHWICFCQLKLVNNIRIYNVNITVSHMLEHFIEPSLQYTFPDYGLDMTLYIISRELKYREALLLPRHVEFWTSGASSDRRYFSDKQKLSGCPHAIVYMCAMVEMNC